MTCPCKPTNPENLREVVKCVEPTLFHKVERPASLGDDTATPPEDLDYKNVLLVYQANGHAYLYSSDGVPTFISYTKSDADISLLEEALHELQANLANEVLERSEADEKFAQELQDYAANVANLQTELEGVEANQFDLAQSVGALESTSVQRDTTVSADASTVTLTKSVGPLDGEATETAIPLPVASSTEAGVMNTATYNAVQENSENIDSILGGAVVLQDLPAEPTDEQLTDAWKEATGKTELINRASIYDETNKKVWYYYENANAWKAIDATPSFSVSIATNDTTGIVKGSNDIFVEPDGSLSVVGLDAINHDIENLTQLVAGIEVPKAPQEVYGFNNISQRLQFISDGPSELHLKTTAFYSSDGHSATSNVGFPIASESKPGAMSAADKSKLDSLLEIKSLNDSLELDENGQLSVVGGGSSINLLSEYSATVGDNDTYNASYVNSRLNNGIVSIGRNANAFVVSDAFNSTIAIGYGAIAGNANDTTEAIAIGRNSIASAAYSMAIGSFTKANNTNSIAIGFGTATTRSEEVSIGTVTPPNGLIPVTRYLANVTPGTLPTDAVNLQQMQDYVAEHGGNPFTEMETTRVKNLPPAVVTGFEDTTYGADTITMHLDTKDLATGGVSVQELMLEGATANTAEAGGHAGLMTAFQATQLATLAAGGAGGLTADEVTKVQNLGTGSLTNMDGVLQTEEAVEIEFSRQNLVAGGSTTQTATISAATTEEAGVMTPTMVAQLNQIGDVATVLETLTTGAGV